MKKQHFWGVLGLLAVTIIWGGGFTATDIALRRYSPLQILTIRFLLGAVVMAFFARKEIKRIERPAWIAGSIMGFLLFSAFWLQTVAQVHTTASKNAFLTATNVVMVPFIAWLVYKVKIGTHHLIGAVMTIAGVGLLSVKGGERLNPGDFYSIGCAVGFALHIFFTGYFAKKNSAMALNLIQMTIACLLSLAMLVIRGETVVSLRNVEMLSVAYLGVFSTCLCFFLQTASQKYTNETEAGIILSMESVFGTLFSVWILGEHITWKMMFGCLIILSAILISEFGQTIFERPKKEGM
ncbi:MAG: DMT family transporter [Eubacteriales bacterium]|nr:DMT family transporter [Eubacteriales bacterium]